MSKNRLTKRLTKQPTISSISSHIPLMMTSKNDANRSITQSITDTHATPDVHTFLPTYPVNTNRDTKRTRTVCQPEGTIPYTVGNADTLAKVALRFHTTPSSLLQLNKLISHMVFPGQVLYVPEECPLNNSDKKQPNTATSLPPPSVISPPSSAKVKEGDAFILLSDRRLSSDSSPPPLSPPPNQSQENVGSMIWSMARQIAARPGRAQRLQSNPSTESEPSPKTSEDHLTTPTEDHSKQTKMPKHSLSVDENQVLDEECLQRFIKLNVRLMTEDRQTVAGTLLVTPNAVMFDPDVLDALVKEHGIDKYGLIIRMDYLAGIALYEDFAMYEHAATSRDEEKRKMYHSTSVKNPSHCPTNSILNTGEEQIHELMSSLLDRIDKELNPPILTDTCCKIFDASSAVQRHISKNSLDNNTNNFDDDTYLPTPTNDNLLEDSLQFSNDLFQSLDDYKHSIGILLEDDNNDNVNKNFNRVPSQGCHLENCVPLDQFNKRFGEIDKLLYKSQQNYFAPQSIEIPYYLCIKTSIHIHDIPSLHPKQYRKNTEKVIDNAYGKKQLEYEYWFSVPKDKSDQLYKFFLRWTPERELDPLIDDEEPQTNIDQTKHNDKAPNKGFVLLATDDPELTGDYISTKNTKNNQQQKQAHYLKRQNTLLKEWEIISVDEIYRRINATHSDDIHDYGGIPAPTLLQPSTLINEEQSKQILIELPPRVHGLNWYMVFSTETNGFSLNQLYRRSLEIDHDSPSLLIVKDLDQKVFGAFVPHQLVVSEGFYGTGESFLFTFHPQFRVFNWSGFNEFFVKGDLNSLGFGIGEGTYGLWLDGDLYHGRTCASKTFKSEKLSSNEDFIIASIEVWTFIN